ncbi:MAG: carboxypeptidase-like regulatory domain-containing protein, partial [Flavobacteriales bacterium]
MKKFLFVIFIAFSQLLSAQDTGTLSGLLTDKEVNNESLPFANVFIIGTNIGTTTDFDGNYSFKVPAGTHVVSFSFLGYKTVEKTFTIAASQTLVLNQI